MLLGLGLLVVTGRVLPVQAVDCDIRGWKDWPLLQRLYQAGIILYGRDTQNFNGCADPETDCETTPGTYREYSTFDVYCVLKNNGPPVPKNITIHPHNYGGPCVKTYFNNGVSGWVYLAMVRYESGHYYWDEINNQSALTTIYVVNTDVRLRTAATLCNLPLPEPPLGGSQDGCPDVFNVTRSPDECFEGKNDKYTCLPTLYRGPMYVDHFKSVIFAQKKQRTKTLKKLYGKRAMATKSKWHQEMNKG